MRPSGILVSIRQDLVEGASRTGTTLIVDPLITKDGHRVTMADIGDICFAKIDQGNSNEEIISFTGITDNTTTYTLTGCVWGYNFYNLTGSVANNQKKHVSGASFGLYTDDHQLQTQYVNTDETQTIAGAKIFSTTPKSSAGSPIDNTDLVIKSYVDALVLGTLTTINVIVPGKAGETVAAGQLVYFDETDNEWKLTDADTATTVENVLLGIAQGSGTNGNAITNGVLLQGVDINQSGLTEGDVQYASNTAGAISSTPGTIEVTVGIAKSATELYFNPRFNQQITENQQDALAGTSGTPSATNKYETYDDTAENTPGKLVRRTASGSILGVIGVNASFTAGEDITAGEAVILSNGTEEAKEASFESGDDSNRTITTTAWEGQTFLTSATAKTIRKVELYITDDNGAITGNVMISIRATSAGSPTGTDLQGETAVVAAAGTDGFRTFTFSNPILVSPNTTYAIIARRTGTGGTVNLRSDGSSPSYANGTDLNSTDSGANWTIRTTDDCLFKVYEGKTIAGEVYLANATSNTERANNFIGFASEDIDSSASGYINLVGIDNNQTGLSVGSTYYLSNTPGAIATSAGSQSRKIGLALSQTELLIKHDNV